MHACKQGARKWEKEIAANRKVHISQCSLCLNLTGAQLEGVCRERNCLTNIVMMASDLKSWWAVCPCPFLCHKQQDSGEVKPKGKGASDNLSVLQLWEPKDSTLGRKWCSPWMDLGLGTDPKWHWGFVWPGNFRL